MEQKPYNESSSKPVYSLILLVSFAEEVNFNAFICSSLEWLSTKAK